MTIIDGIILGISFLSALMGLVRGLTREVLGLASWIGGTALTFTGMPFVQIIARRYISNPMMADIAAAIGLFILFLILFSIISNALSGLIKQSVLGGIDRSLGFLFGVARSIIVLCVFQLLVSCFIPRHKQPIDFQNNRFAPMIYNGSNFIMTLLPKQVVLKIVEQQQKRITENFPSVSAMGIVTSELTNNLANQMSAAEQVMTASKKNQSVSAQQEAENLSRLQPKVTTPTEEATITLKQQNDLNRFLNIQDMDDPEEQPDLAPQNMPALHMPSSQSANSMHSHQ
ncbi:MAG: CvpA family protein [Candidatus Paracaedibacteraceae bacterium]|nr:CvpA family protein [Candidatus Paracaedibacteraceae bacterium]